MKSITFEGNTYLVDPVRSSILRRTCIDKYKEGERSEWVVLDDLICYSHRLSIVIKVPRFFITDLASIPKPLRSLISVNERHVYAAIIHDFLYTGHLFDTKVSRQDADGVLNDFCEIVKVPTWKRTLIFSAVRTFGSTRFHKASCAMIPVCEMTEYDILERVKYYAK